MDARLQRIRELIELKEKTDAELDTLIAGAPVKESKPRVCSKCSQEGHTARTCPNQTGATE